MKSRIPKESFPALLLVALLATLADCNVPSYLRRYSRGPNVCVVQETFGTREKFFTECVGTHLRMICERPTFVSLECCSGYGKKPGEEGCTAAQPLENLYDSMETLRLREFASAVERAGLKGELTNYGAYTVFAPDDKAMRMATTREREGLFPRDRTKPSTVKYHIAPGRINFTEIRGKNNDYPTTLRGEMIRVNKFMYGVFTVNCARVIRPNQMATNGIIHIVDKVIHPLDELGTIAEQILEDDRFAQLQQALFVSNLVNRLRGEGPYTLVAPTDAAFAKLPAELFDRILTDADTAQKVLENHIMKGVYCADAIVIAMGVKNLGGQHLMFRCKRDALYVEDAKVLQEDMVASNGVIHAIDTVLVPDSVKNLAEIADDMKLNQLMNYTRRHGLTGVLSERNEATLFAPTDEAFSKLPLEYLAALTSQPLAMERLLNYHKVKGRVTSDQLVGDQDLETGLSARIKVNIYRNGIAIDDARVVRSDKTCQNGVVHSIDKVLIPPDKDLMDVISSDEELTTFASALEASGMAEVLKQPGHFTVLAPTNYAFRMVSRRTLDRLLTSPDRLKTVMERHIINRVVIQCAVEPETTYGIKSRQGDMVEFTRLKNGQNIYVQGTIRADPSQEIATNGYIYKVTRLLPCTCERY